MGGERVSKKTNPRKRPVSQADLDRAVDEAITRLLQMVLYVLVDKHGATQEDIGQIAAERN